MDLADRGAWRLAPLQRRGSRWRRCPAAAGIRGVRINTAAQVWRGLGRASGHAVEQPLSPPQQQASKAQAQRLEEGDHWQPKDFAPLWASLPGAAVREPTRAIRVPAAAPRTWSARNWRISHGGGTLGHPQRVPMAGSHQWSVMLTTTSLRRPRWLSDSGRLTSDPRRALRLMSADVAAQRLQAFIRLRGWELSRLERFQLVPAPQLEEFRAGQGRMRVEASWHSRDSRRLSA